MSRAGVVRLLQAQPDLLDANAQRFADRLASVRSLMRGVTRKRTSLANALCSVAASASVYRIPPASFSANCDLAADLAAAAAPDAGASRADKLSAVLRHMEHELDELLCSQRNLDKLFCSRRDAAELRAVFAALQQHLGWSAQQAGSALLGLGLLAGPDGKQPVSSEGAPRLHLYHISAQQIEEMSGVLRQYGLQGDELAAATYAGRADWAPIAPAEVDEALADFAHCLGQSGLPPRLAAKLWLAAGIATASESQPAFLDAWVCLAQAGVPAEHLEALATALLLPDAKPAWFASSMQLLHERLGSWPAAAEAAAADPSLLTSCLLPKAEGVFAPSTAAPDITALSERLLAAASEQEQLQLLTECVLIAASRRVSRTQALGSLQLLTTLLGSPEAAVEAAAVDSRLLQLPYDDDDMQHVFECLSTAGLSQKQLRRLAIICKDHVEYVDRLSVMAEQLYAGDWHAAMLEFLKGWRVYVGCLCRLRNVLDVLEEVGLEVANETGRQHVLQLIKKEERIELRVEMPYPPAQQPSVILMAALEQQGFRATGSKTVQLIGRLAADPNLSALYMTISEENVEFFSVSVSGRSHVFDGEDWCSCED